MLPLVLALITLAGLHMLHRLGRARTTSSSETTILDHRTLPGGTSLSWLMLGEREVVVITHRSGAHFHELGSEREKPDSSSAAWDEAPTGFGSRLAS